MPGWGCVLTIRSVLMAIVVTGSALVAGYATWAQWSGSLSNPWLVGSAWYGAIQSSVFWLVWAGRRKRKAKSTI